MSDGKPQPMNGRLHEHVPEETLHTWLDGELSSREVATVSSHVERCAECAATLDGCREVCTTVSQLLGAYDSEMAQQEITPRAKRPKLVLSSRVPSAPIISHIVADSQSARFLPNAKMLVPIAAMLLLFVGGAATMMMRSYHSLSNSVSTFAVELPVQSPAGAASVGARQVSGTIVTVGGMPISQARVRVRGSNARALTDANGWFYLADVPVDAKFVDVSAIGYSPAAFALEFDDKYRAHLKIKLLPFVRTLDPVVVKRKAPFDMK